MIQKAAQPSKAWTAKSSVDGRLKSARLALKKIGPHDPRHVHADSGDPSGTITRVCARGAEIQEARHGLSIVLPVRFLHPARPWKPARTVSPGRAALEGAAGRTGARHGTFRVGAGRRIRRAIEAADQSRRYPGYSAVEVAARLAAVSFAA